MNKNVKIAKEILKLAKSLLAGNDYEEFSPDTYNKVMNMPADDFIAGLTEFLDRCQTYMASLSQLNANVQNVQIKFSKNPAIQYYQQHPEAINLTNVMGEYGQKGLQAPENALKQLERQMAEGTKFAGIIYPVLLRINRICQQCAAQVANQKDISLLVDIINLLKRYNAELRFKNTQGENTKEKADLITEEYVIQKLNGNKDIKIRLAGLNKQMTQCTKNIRMAIALLGEDESIDKLGQQIIACSSISSIAQDQAHLKARKDKGLEEIPKAISWSEQKKIQQQEQQDKSNAGIPNAPFDENKINKLNQNLQMIKASTTKNAGIISDVGDWFVQKASALIDGFKSVYQKVKEFVKNLLGIEKDLKEADELNQELSDFVNELSDIVNEQ